MQFFGTIKNVKSVYTGEAYMVFKIPSYTTVSTSSRRMGLARTPGQSGTQDVLVAWNYGSEIWLAAETVVPANSEISFEMTISR